MTVLQRESTLNITPSDKRPSSALNILFKNMQKPDNSPELSKTNG